MAGFSRIMSRMYAYMSVILSGWASATIATYVQKADTQVGSAATLLVSGSLAWDDYAGRASRRYARAMLSILLTSFAGMGAKLEARLKAGGDATLFYTKNGVGS